MCFWVQHFSGSVVVVVVPPNTHSPLSQKLSFRVFEKNGNLSLEHTKRCWGYDLLEGELSRIISGGAREHDDYELSVGLWY